MKGVIGVSQNIVEGAFPILFTFIREVDFTFENVLVETLEGDALGNSKDRFAGSGSNYYMTCYLTEGMQGRSRISVPGWDVPAVEVEYDTVYWLVPEWGVSFQQNGNIEIPLSFPVPIMGLKKKHFGLSIETTFQVFGAEDSYSVVIPGTLDLLSFRITVSGLVKRKSGMQAEIRKRALEV